MKRNIIFYTALTILTIVCGLLSRSQYLVLPNFVATYSGDTLWALMVFWAMCTILPGQKTQNLIILSLVFSFGIEISQLYHAPWIDNIRATTLGALVLGFGFQFSDLLCYSAGICFGALADFFILSRTKVAATEPLNGSVLINEDR